MGRAMELEGFDGGVVDRRNDVGGGRGCDVGWGGAMRPVGSWVGNDGGQWNGR